MVFGCPGNWEPASAISGAIIFGVEIARRVNRKATIASRFPSGGAKIQHREKLRKQFEEELYNCRAQELRQDAIVPHIDRVDDYPNTDDENPGISAWFRAGFLDMYERGIVLCLPIGDLKNCAGGYRFVDYANH